MGLVHALLLVRHGKAEDEGEHGDAARALTAKSRRAFRRHSAGLSRRVKLTAIATSPLVRAVQTAEILAEHFDLDDVIVRPELAIERASRDTVVALARELGVGWALVGHNPALGEALPKLLGVRKEAVSFRKGAVVALVPRPDGSRWELCWRSEPGEDLREDLEDT